jgi:hypothetical protein
MYIRADGGGYLVVIYTSKIFWKYNVREKKNTDTMYITIGVVLS